MLSQLCAYHPLRPSATSPILKYKNGGGKIFFLSSPKIRFWILGEVAEGRRGFGLVICKPKRDSYQ